MNAVATETSNVVQTNGLGKQYGSFWALKDCTITVPSGSVTALVGPNGAGKTTLLKLLVNLSSPSAGSATVLGMSPNQSSTYLSEIGYLAQEIPLYSRMTVLRHLAIGAHMDTNWDNDLALSRLQELKIPLDRAVGSLSGGQRAQVGLALALAKKPRLLLLDEPVAALDPLARIEFLTSLTQAVADSDGALSVVMSSHLLADLERVCDHLILLAAGKTQLCDSIEHIIETHKLLAGPHNEKTSDPAYTIIRETQAANETDLLVRTHDKHFRSQKWHIHDTNIEDIVLAYMKQAKQERDQQ
ncbi:MAG TPA: ABC transporter ATP-binding protein [Candidatus Saccharimonadales bacterium]|nr:ABC transporter ATP-binding protein [Candidatus Saccharimonadales bacterium]